MFKKFKMVVAAMALAVVSMGAAGTSADAAPSERYGSQKVVYHINYNGGEEDKKWRGAMKNIQNHINAVGAENMEIKVVLHGNGVNMLKSAKTNEALQMDITSLKTQAVNFHVCNNTLTGRKISYEDDLFEVFEDDIVPSGVAELSHLQQQGFTYIKP